MNATKEETKQPKVKISNLKEGDILSESSHYKVVGIQPDSVVLFHLETNANVTIADTYIRDILTSADQFESELLVGKEDKHWTATQIAKEAFPTGSELPRAGDVKLKGIRSIFEQIYTSEVFTVCFQKQDKPMGAKQHKQLITHQINAAVEAILMAQTKKTGVANMAEEQIKNIIANPILPYVPGEDRVLRGFKTQFTSRDGRYECVDMDITPTETETNIRPVNINTIKWLIYRGVKYIVEK